MLGVKIVHSGQRSSSAVGGFRSDPHQYRGELRVLRR